MREPGRRRPDPAARPPPRVPWLPPPSGPCWPSDCSSGPRATPCPPRWVPRAGHGVRLPLTPTRAGATPGSAGHELPGRRDWGAGLGATGKPRAPPGQTLRAAGDPLGTR